MRNSLAYQHLRHLDVFNRQDYLDSLDDSEEDYPPIQRYCDGCGELHSTFNLTKLKAALVGMARDVEYCKECVVKWEKENL